MLKFLVAGIGLALAVICLGLVVYGLQAYWDGRASIRKAVLTAGAMLVLITLFGWLAVQVLADPSAGF